MYLNDVILFFICIVICPIVVVFGLPKLERCFREFVGCWNFRCKKIASNDAPLKWLIDQFSIQVEINYLLKHGYKYHEMVSGVVKNDIKWLSRMEKEARFFNNEVFYSVFDDADGDIKRRFEKKFPFSYNEFMKLRRSEIENGVKKKIIGKFF